MNPSPDRPSQGLAGRLVTAAALALAWWIPVALAATQTKVRASTGPGEPVTWLQAFAFQLPLWSPLLIVAPFAFRIARRQPLESLPRIGRLLVLFGLGLGLAIAYLVMSAAVSLAVESRPITPATILSAAGGRAVRTFHLNLFIVSALIAAGYARENYLRVQAETLRAAHFREQLSEARLSALKAQLRPHFLFNVLHSISSLVDEDKAMAQEMIAALSDLLRHTLHAADGQHTALAKELESADLYLAIEKIRFQDRLTVGKSIVPEALSAKVPALLLQPLVENAVIHGVEKLEGASRIEIKARIVDRTLVLEVMNTHLGAGEEEIEVPLGVGLGNTRARLGRLYGDQAAVDLVASGDQMRAIVRLPFTAVQDLSMEEG